MPAIFRRHPDVPKGNYTESHQGRGSDYEEQFALLPMRALMWQLEKEILGEFLGMTQDVHEVIDLACGTGRVSGILTNCLPDAQVTGVDVAESMLSVARANVADATFVSYDVKELGTAFPPRSVDLLTAFRFFPNADPSLRDAAVDAVNSVVRPGGYVMMNNHRNFWSTSYVARRLRSGSSAPGTINREVTRPLLDRGFEVLAHRSLGLVPQTESKPYIVSQGFASRVERWNTSKFGKHHTAGTNTIWLLRKSSNA